MGVQRLAIPDLGRIFRGDTVSGLSEWQLLERYLERRDESAFEALVIRHGPMVLGVCRRMLGGSSEVEDAFQATFLILVRRAPRPRADGMRSDPGCTAWPSGSRPGRGAGGARRRQRSAPLAFTVPDLSGSTVDPDLVEVLDLELGRLPGKYRSPLVLCYLEGRTHEEAARDLNWPVGTVKGRLARAGSCSDRGWRAAGSRRRPASSACCRRPNSSWFSIARWPSVPSRLPSSWPRASPPHRSFPGPSLLWSKESYPPCSSPRSSGPRWRPSPPGFAFTSAAVLGRQDPPPKADESAKVSTAEKPYGKAFLTEKKVEAPGEYQKPIPPPDSAQAGGMRKKAYARVEVEIGGRDDGRANDPRSKQILAKLEEPISMSFPTRRRWTTSSSTSSRPRRRRPIQRHPDLRGPRRPAGGRAVAELDDPDRSGGCAVAADACN